MYVQSETTEKSKRHMIGPNEQHHPKTKLTVGKEKSFLL
jgi:hypothetical protein